jgi:hypothetical protein
MFVVTQISLYQTARHRVLEDGFLEPSWRNKYKNKNKNKNKNLYVHCAPYAEGLSVAVNVPALRCICKQFAVPLVADLLCPNGANEC